MLKQQMAALAISHITGFEQHYFNASCWIGYMSNYKVSLHVHSVKRTEVYKANNIVEAA